MRVQRPEARWRLRQGTRSGRAMTYRGRAQLSESKENGRRPRIESRRISRGVGKRRYRLAMTEADFLRALARRPTPHRGGGLRDDRRAEGAGRGCVEGARDAGGPRNPATVSGFTAQAGP